jgi:GT2 family glycosyltransferase
MRTVSKAEGTEVPGLSIAIPTYGRDSVLLDSIGFLLTLIEPVDEVLVIDQTPMHEADTEMALTRLAGEGRIRWLRLPHPSIPAAMNRGLLEARNNLVLFLDDDIVPDPQLLDAHRQAHVHGVTGLVAGRVSQPWHGSDEPDPTVPGQFSFNGGEPALITEFMGGNFSVSRDRAIAIGGFDENFVRVAYRFEAEFAYRWMAAGEKIQYAPNAWIRHLKVQRGGTRSFGEHQETVRPDHAVGAYYYSLRTRKAARCVWDFLIRPVRAIATRHHLSRPWWIPLTLLAETRAMIWAVQLAFSGPRLLRLNHPSA